MNLLIRFDTHVPRCAVELFLENLVHDSIQIRTIAVCGFKKILFLLKPIRKLTIDQFATETYDSLQLDCFTDKEVFEKTIFYDKIHDGYIDDIPRINTILIERDYSKYEFIIEKFKNEKFLDKFFALHSVENLTTIEVNRVKMFKHLFQIFKLFNWNDLTTRLNKLFDLNKDYCDKLAIEILSGVVRASPWLGYDHLMMFKNYLLSIVFRKYLVRLNKESYDYWYYLFQAMFNKRDIRRWLWVFEYFFGHDHSPITAFSSFGPYFQASFMNFAANALLTNWKFVKVSENVLVQLEKHLNHQYKFIRVSVA